MLRAFVLAGITLAFICTSANAAPLKTVGQESLAAQENAKFIFERVEEVGTRFIEIREKRILLTQKFTFLAENGSLPCGDVEVEISQEYEMVLTSNCKLPYVVAGKTLLVSAQMQFYIDPNMGILEAVRTPDIELKEPLPEAVKEIVGIQGGVQQDNRPSQEAMTKVAYELMERIVVKEKQYLANKPK